MLPPFLLALAVAVATVSPAFGQESESIYMGKASTGEPVWYNGAHAQCGDLPPEHECWKNPMVSYTIGSDHVGAIPDCKKGVFKEVWIGDRVVSRNMRPSSQAIRSVLETACNSVKANTQPSVKAIRPLAPDREPSPSESPIDGYFRQALEAEVKGDFDIAIGLYEKASDTADNECDRQHAQAGIQAATYAKKLLQQHGWSSRPTQSFWSNFQRLTKPLVCVRQPD